MLGIDSPGLVGSKPNIHPVMLSSRTYEICNIQCIYAVYYTGSKRLQNVMYWFLKVFEIVNHWMTDSQGSVLGDTSRARYYRTEEGRHTNKHLISHT